MKATVEKPESWRRSITIEIPDEEVQVTFQKKLDKYRREVKLPGFRPGKVPQNLLKGRFGPTIRAEVIDELINTTFRDACGEYSIVPVSGVTISDLKAEENSPVIFTAEVEVDPEIEISGYKKLKFRASPKKIKDADVEAALNNLRERMAVVTDVDRASKKGDLILFEYLNVVVDGVPRTDVKSPQYPIEIGGGQLKDFDTQLVGLSAGQEADLSVTFPKEYHIQEIAGKVADVKIKVTKVQEKRIPEVDEEFCKKAGDFAGKEALIAAIRTDLEAQEKNRARTEAHNKAIEALIEHNDFEVPPARIELYLDRVMEEQTRYYRLETLPSREEFDARFRQDGIAMIKRFRIIDYIATQEKIKATQEEVDTRIRQIAAYYGKPFEEIKAALRKDGTTMRMRDEIREQKTLDKLIGEIPWEEETPPEGTDEKK